MKRDDLKKLYKFEDWTRINSEQSVLAAYDTRHSGYWEVTANSEGEYRIRRRPDAYESDDRSYLEGQVPVEGLRSSKEVYTAAKKAARESLENLLKQLAAEEGAAPLRPAKVRKARRVAPVMSASPEMTHTEHVPPQHTSQRYLYKPLLRPASFASVPKGWDYAEAPLEYAPNRRDVPRSEHKYGIIYYNRPLTEDEMEHFSLERVWE